MSDSEEADRGSLEQQRGNLTRIDVEKLFNLPLYEHHLVIDTRSAEDFTNGHIVSAVSYPSPTRGCSDLEREKTLIKFIKGYVKEYCRCVFVCVCERERAQDEYSMPVLLLCSW